MSGEVAGVVRLLPGRERGLAEGRPWVYGNEVAEVAGNPGAGETVDVFDARGRFQARGFYNERSLLRVRVLTRDPGVAVDGDLLAGRIEAAWRYRGRVLPDREACRAVFAEADLLPGLVVDRFGEVAVVQLLSAGLERWRGAVLEALRACLEPDGVKAAIARHDTPVRDWEGLPREVEWLWGGERCKAWRAPDGEGLEVPFGENGLRWSADVEGGQKTGHFLDQRFNRAALAPFAPSARVLDAFCHTGGFGIHAAVYGASRVTLLDSDRRALGLAVRHAERNGVADRVEPVCANAFDQLKEWQREGRRYDLVILDPPAFARARRQLEGAWRGYKEINLRALRMLAPGGILVTSSCSQPVTSEIFGRILHEAAVDARREVRVIERRGAAPDHPELLGADETQYLKCWILQVL